MKWTTLLLATMLLTACASEGDMATQGPPAEVDQFECTKQADMRVGKGDPDWQLFYEECLKRRGYTP